MSNLYSSLFSLFYPLSSELKDKILFYAKQGRSRNEIFDALTQPHRVKGKIVRNGLVKRREIQEIIKSIPKAERKEARRLYWSNKEEKILELQETWGWSRREAKSKVREASYEALRYRHDPSRKKVFERIRRVVSPLVVGEMDVFHN